ncbi:MAG: Calx-beta domain-containing protein, partial [Planctomycetota bacterium]
MFKSNWLRKLPTIFHPLALPLKARRRPRHARQSVQSLEPRDLLTVSLSLSAFAVSEADDAATRVITLTAENDTPVLADSTVEIAVTGLSGSDFSLSDVTILIPAGQSQGSVTLTINDDNLVELTEAAVIFLINPTGGLIIDPADGQQSLTVSDNDQALLSIDNVAILEGDSGTALLVFTVTLDAAVEGPVTVDFATANNTATAGVDYTATSGTLTFAAAVAAPQTRQITVDVTGDQLVELDETLFVNLLNLNAGAYNVVIAVNQGLGTIQNNDQAQLSINDVAILEGDSGTAQLVFTVTLNAAVNAPVTVNFETANNTAMAGVDYTATSSMLTFAANAAAPQTRQITVDVTGDQLVELNETLFVNLLNLNAAGRNVVIADSQGLGTIQNDDQAQLSINDVTIAEGNS